MGRVSEFIMQNFYGAKFYILSKLIIILIFRKPVFYREAVFEISPATLSLKHCRIKDTNPTD